MLVVGCCWVREQSLNLYCFAALPFLISCSNFFLFCSQVNLRQRVEPAKLFCFSLFEVYRQNYPCDPEMATPKRVRTYRPKHSDTSLSREWRINMANKK